MLHKQLEHVHIIPKGRVLADVIQRYVLPLIAQALL